MIRSSFVMGVSALALVVVTSCSGDPAMTDAGTMMDAGVIMDTGTPTDARPDRPPMDSGEVMCPNPKPDLSSFKPDPVPTPRVSSDACNAMQLDDYWKACRAMGATNMTCTPWRTAMANVACAQCLESADTDAQWGPLVYGSGKLVTMGIIKSNYEGCLVKLGQGACATAIWEASQCTKVACEEQCPVSDQASKTLYDQCVNKAAMGACKTYQTNQSTACSSAEAGAAIQACRGSNFEDYYRKIAPIFCSAGG